MRDRRAVRRRHLMLYMRVYDAATRDPVGMLADISSRGMMLTGETPFVPGERRSFRINLPQAILEAGCLGLACTVAWSKRVHRTGLYNTGFKDLALPDHERLRLERLMDDYDLRDAG